MKRLQSENYLQSVRLNSMSEILSLQEVDITKVCLPACRDRACRYGCVVSVAWGQRWHQDEESTHKVEGKGVHTHGPTEAVGNRGSPEEGGVTEKGVSVWLAGWLARLPVVACRRSTSMRRWVWLRGNRGSCPTHWQTRMPS